MAEGMNGGVRAAPGVWAFVPCRRKNTARAGGNPPRRSRSRRQARPRQPFWEIHDGCREVRRLSAVYGRAS